MRGRWCGIIGAVLAALVMAGMTAMAEEPAPAPADELRTISQEVLPVQKRGRIKDPARGLARGRLPAS